MRQVMGLMAWGVLIGGTGGAAAGDWPQFRGPNAAGVAAGNHKLPAQIGPDQNIVWKVPVPPGHSSPVVHGDHVYLTAVREKELVTICLDRATGTTLWERGAPHKGLEKIHQIGSHAQPSPATDGKYVISFFGSSGLDCHDPAGKLVWRKPLGPFKNEFGAGSSPAIVGDAVVLNQDHDSGSFLLVADKHTGKTRWQVERPEFMTGYATPIIWEVEGKKQVVVAGTLRAIGYDFETGREIWTVRNMARISNMTPVLGPDNTLYVAAWSPGADAGERFDVLPFGEFAAKHDADKNGTLEANEMPAGPLKDRFAQIDRDKNGHVTKEEYESVRRIIETAQNRMIAIKPGGTGDITETHVLWAQNRQLPYVPSPLFYQGHVFLVKNGGILSCFDAKTGKPTKQERVPGPGNYYSSPVGGDGKVYVVSQQGDLTVISAEAEWKILGRAKFGEEVFATPALVDGRIYLRTKEYLYCFGEKP